MIQILNAFALLGIRIWILFIICCLVPGIFLANKSDVFRYPPRFFKDILLRASLCRRITAQVF